MEANAGDGLCRAAPFRVHVIRETVIVSNFGKAGESLLKRERMSFSPCSALASERWNQPSSGQVAFLLLRKAQSKFFWTQGPLSR